MNGRIQRLSALFDCCSIDAFLVTNDVNITYLTQTPAGEGWLLVTRSGAFYLTDPRYSEEAKKKFKGVRVRVYDHRKTIFILLAELARLPKIRKIGFHPGHISLDLFDKMKQACAGIKFIRQKDCVEGLRMVKSRHEIDLIKKAVALNLKAFQYLRGVIKPGMSERELLARLELFVRQHRVSFSFDPIIASGPNSCFPHARITDRRFHTRDVVMVDMGIDVDGYKSDLTRIFFLGKIPPLIRETVEKVKAAQEAAIRSVGPGITAEQVDQSARNCLKKNGLERFFTHSLGHGIGLEVHEAPGISPKNKTVLQPGMIFTVEPAVYIHGKFGIRIEDMVLVTQKGCEIISAE